MDSQPSFVWPVCKQVVLLMACEIMSIRRGYRLLQWFPNGVSRHPGVSGGTTRCIAKLKTNI
jgi:hypothetical protein